MRKDQEAMIFEELPEAVQVKIGKKAKGIQPDDPVNIVPRGTKVVAKVGEKGTREIKMTEQVVCNGSVCKFVYDKEDEEVIMWAERDENQKEEV